MCKCCQSALETCYWNCCEKRFCLDDDIVLWEDPDEKKTEKNNNAFDNMAFYDNVALIANRAIFTIEPLPPKDKQPIVVQPKRQLRWFEDEEQQNKANERLTATISKRKMSTVPEEDHDNLSVDAIDGVITEEPTEDEVQEKERDVNNTKEDKEDSKSAEVKKESEILELRKKSLQQRRMSKGLTLKIDRDRTELPLIRQSSIPKFYLETPEKNQIDSTVARTPSIALTAPIKPAEFQFDLKSVVQIHKETSPSKEDAKPKRVMSFKEKLLRRQSSNMSIASVHM